jgi:predicted MFS family arabinose efflux permease
MTFERRLVCVLLPFAVGYYLSYVFRTINALIAGALSDEFGLGPADLGLLTSMYFLVMAAVQWPLGVLLDCYGPRRVQSACLLVTAAGAYVFAVADSFSDLVLGRALIGIGVATALMAGLKAVVLWFPPERVGFANGLLVTAGALGAVTASAPAQGLIDRLGWRGLFLLLAVLALAAAALMMMVVPERCRVARTASVGASASLGSIYRDARFWTLAPLSATTIGAAWSIQGLWAAPWLTDVEGFDRATVVQHLLVMGLALCGGALLLGTLADRLRQRGIPVETLFGAMAALFMLAQLMVILRWPVPSLVSWALIGMAGAATVLSFAILPGYFPKEVSGRANAALNLLHLSAAFSAQWLTGVIIDQWPSAHGRHPVVAYRVAFGLNLAVQAMAFGWFVASRRRAAVPATIAATNLAADRAPPAVCRYRQAHRAWQREVTAARQHAARWRVAAALSMATSVVLLILITAGPASLRAGDRPATDTGATPPRRTAQPDGPLLARDMSARELRLAPPNGLRDPSRRSTPP